MNLNDILYEAILEIKFLNLILMRRYSCGLSFIDDGFRGD